MKKALSQKSAADKDVVNFREDFLRLQWVWRRAELGFNGFEVTIGGKQGCSIGLGWLHASLMELRGKFHVHDSPRMIDWNP